MTPTRPSPNQSEPSRAVPDTTIVTVATRPTSSAAANSTVTASPVALVTLIGPARMRSVRSTSSSPRSRRVVASSAHTARMSWMIQPPSHTVNPPAVSMAWGTPCIIRTAGLSSNIENCCGGTPSG